MAQALFSMIAELWTTFSVDAAGIRKDNPLKFLAWYVSVSELQLVELDISHGATLTIRTAGDRKRSMPLFRSANEQLATLYPELLKPSDKSEFTPWVIKWLVIAVVLLGLITAGVLLYASRI